MSSGKLSTVFFNRLRYRRTQYFLFTVPSKTLATMALRLRQLSNPCSTTCARVPC